MNTQLSFGEYVRHLRRRKGWNLQDLAEGSGLSLAHLSRLENDNGIPSADTVVRLANALEGDLDQMLSLANCLPQEILERLSRRAGANATALRRSSGSQADRSFPRALVEDMDPGLRRDVARHFNISIDDVDGIFQILRKIAAMTPEERGAILRFLGTTADSGAEGT
jgi:transcriptional regulator with XRE-family HTH domain